MASSSRAMQTESSLFLSKMLHMLHILMWLASLNSPSFFLSICHFCLSNYLFQWNHPKSLNQLKQSHSVCLNAINLCISLLYVCCHIYTCTHLSSHRMLPLTLSACSQSSTDLRIRQFVCFFFWARSCCGRIRRLERQHSEIGQRASSDEPCLEQTKAWLCSVGTSLNHFDLPAPPVEATRISLTSSDACLPVKASSEVGAHFPGLPRLFSD